MFRVWDSGRSRRVLNHAKEAISGTYNLYSYWTERKGKR
jgi:hypothetical protein